MCRVILIMCTHTHTQPIYETVSFHMGFFLVLGLFLFCMYEYLPACMYILELELQTVLSHHLDAAN